MKHEKITYALIVILLVVVFFFLYRDTNSLQEGISISSWLLHVS